MDQQITEKVYDFITDEGEERACEAISEKACREVPGNFLKNVFSGGFSKLANQLVSPGTTLPWIFSALSVPPALVGALVPIKDAGSLLPQLVVSAKIRAYSRRKWFWVIPSAVQGICLLAMAWVVKTQEELWAGIWILALLALFSMASGVASISFKDVLAKTIEKGKRGQLLAYRSTLGGIFTILAGVFLFLQQSEKSEDINYLFWLVMAGGACWLISAGFFSGIDEQPGAIEGGRSPITELKQGKQLWKENANLRRFIITRGLLMSIPLAQPFFVVIAQRELGDEVKNLGFLVLVAGVGAVLSSPFWGKFADNSSRKMMRIVAILGIGSILMMFSFPLWPDSMQSIYSFAAIFLVHVVIYGGARLSRKTYLVDFAPKDERPLYVSLSNTMIGIFTLMAAALGGVSSLIGSDGMLLVFGGLLAISAVLATKLKEV
ncbi:MFS transporter [Algoriphagus hitonicola]|uniref:MFS-type transporter involved in bile tolerance, Atg22 family n=1 Tax=Algoriphagus hitonicola TaxID=435880 RepID=A0A1I2PCX8_9BACT|nr:MFS transporter [Algoriphagus hitonicola]SFG13373.1 MFS-type transporter involved in bile tolerance, Atg22 family [Algoriphagus hitonicola]